MFCKGGMYNMKQFRKILSLVMVLLIVCTSGYVGEFRLKADAYSGDEFPFGAQTIIQDYSGNIATGWNAGQHSVWGSLSSSSVVNGAWQLVPTNSSTIASARLPLSATSEKYTAISLHVSSPGQSNELFKLRMTIHANTPIGTQNRSSSYQFVVGQLVYLIGDDGVVTTTSVISGNWVEIKDFSGTIVVPMSSFDTAIGNDGYVSPIYSNTTAQINELYLQFDKQTANVAINIDDIAYWEDPVELPYDDTTVVVQDFENFNLNTLYCWGNNFVKETDAKISNGKLVCTYKAGNLATWSVPISKPVSSYLSTSIDIDATGANSFGLRFLFSSDSTNGGSYVSIEDGNIYYIQDAEGNTTELTVSGGGRVAVPAGFVGQIIVPIASYGGGNQSNCALSDIAGVADLRFQVKAFAIPEDDTVVSFDNIGYLTEDLSSYEGISAVVEAENGLQFVAGSVTTAFSNSMAKLAPVIPSDLAELPVINGLEEGNTITVKSAGEIYIITPPTGATNSQQAYFEGLGFAVVKDYAEFTLRDTSSFDHRAIVMKKVYTADEVAAGATFSFGKWAIVLADLEDGNVQLEDMAGLRLGDGTAWGVGKTFKGYLYRKAAKNGEFWFMPSWLDNKELLLSTNGYSANATVMQAGNVYAVPFDETEEASLVSAGFTVVEEAGKFRLSARYDTTKSSSTYNSKLYVKYCNAGEKVALAGNGTFIAVPETDFVSWAYEQVKNLDFNIYTMKDNSDIILNPEYGYRSGTRQYQLSICGEVAEKSGRMWATFMSGGDNEDPCYGTYVPVITSADGGKTWSEPRVIIDIDMMGPVALYCGDLFYDEETDRLYLNFTAQFVPNNHKPTNGPCATYVMYCDDPANPDAKWSEPKLLEGVEGLVGGVNVLSDGSWLRISAIPRSYDKSWVGIIDEKYIGPAYYISKDKGETWERGFVFDQTIYTDPYFPEHSIVELDDYTEGKLGTLKAYFRTVQGLMESTSTDGGVSWSALKFVTDHSGNKLSGVASKSICYKLNSGNLLLVYNKYPTNTRCNMTAALSTDGGKTWSHEMLLFADAKVGYPDVKQTKDGYIYIFYDHNRYVEQDLFLTVLTEQDIINGQITSEKGMLNHVVNNRATALTHLVVVKDHMGNVVKEVNVADGLTLEAAGIEMPSLNRLGYIHIGWTNVAIAVTNDMVITPVFEKDTTTLYDIVADENVEVDVSVPDGQQKFYYNDRVTIVAPSTNDAGQRFAYWDVNGDKFSYSRSISFLLFDNLDIKPVYADAIEEKPIVYTNTNPKYTLNVNKWNMQVMGVVSAEDANVKEIGILISASEMDTQAMLNGYKANNSTVYKCVASNSVNNRQFIYTVKNIKLGQTRCATTYAILADGTMIVSDAVTCVTIDANGNLVK